MTDLSLRPFRDCSKAPPTVTRIQLSDGRMLAFSEYGIPGGKPIFYCHGFPASRLEARLLEPAAVKLGLRLISVDRPGYGLSDFTQNHTLAAWPGDLTQLAKVLGTERFAILGVSGGGPYALACAHAIPERLTAAALVGGLGPVFEPWAIQGQRWHARLGFFLARRARWLLKPLYGIGPPFLMGKYPEIAYSLLTALADDTDRAALTRPEIRPPIVASMREAFRQGARAAMHEFALYANPWGFEFSNIALPVTLWQGGRDQIVPPAHARYLAAALPRSDLRLLPNEGHFSLPINYMHEILGKLGSSLPSFTPSR